MSAERACGAQRGGAWVSRSGGGGSARWRGLRASASPSAASKAPPGALHTAARALTCHESRAQAEAYAVLSADPTALPPRHILLSRVKGADGRELDGASEGKHRRPRSCIVAALANRQSALISRAVERLHPALSCAIIPIPFFQLTCTSHTGQSVEEDERELSRHTHDASKDRNAGFTRGRDGPAALLLPASAAALAAAARSARSRWHSGRCTGQCASRQASQQ